MRSRRNPRRADLALAWLVLLATLSAWLALTLSKTGLESVLALIVTVCRRSVAETVAHGAELGRLSLLLPLTLGLILALVEAVRLMLATRRWITSLTPACRKPTRWLNRLAYKCGLIHATTLVEMEHPFVFTHGFFKPRVWLSTGLMYTLAPDELEAVLRHEAHHRLAHDPLKILIARCLSRALFFVPVARDLGDAYYLAKEIAADEFATLGMSDALPLARALRKLITAQYKAAPEGVLVSELGVTEARLVALLHPAHSQPFIAFRHIGLSLLWVLLLVGILYAPAAGHLPSFAECSMPSSMSWVLRLLMG